MTNVAYLLLRMFGRLGFYKYSTGKKIFWNCRARDVDNQYGKSHDDYDVLKNVISSLKVDRLLDVGCGSGRLFPLYESLGIKEIIGQDISENTLELARARYNYPNLKLMCSPLESIDFPESYFDLVTSTRVLQHIPPNLIESAVKTIYRVSRHIYLDELSDTEGVPENFYCFKHDYLRLFNNHGCTLKDKGLINKRTWLLFEK